MLLTYALCAKFFSLKITHFTFCCVVLGLEIDEAWSVTSRLHTLTCYSTIRAMRLAAERRPNALLFGGRTKQVKADMGPTYHITQALREYSEERQVSIECFFHLC